MIYSLRSFFDSTRCRTTLAIPPSTPKQSGRHYYGFKCEEEEGQEERLPGMSIPSIPFRPLPEISMLITSTEAQVESGQGPSEACEFHRYQLQIKSHRLESAIHHHRSPLGNKPIRTSHILIDLPYRQPAQRLVKLSHHSHRYKANECATATASERLAPETTPSYSGY